MGTYERWLSGTGSASAPTDESDGDGLSHWQEYAFGLNPDSPDAPAFQLGSDGTHPTFDFTHPSAVLDVRYDVEWSPALVGGTWSSNNVTYAVIADDGARRTIRATLPVSGAAQAFVRVKTSR